MIALGNGDGTFATPSVLDLPDGDAIRSAGFAAGDFNGDGNLDLALFDSEAFSGIFYGNGNGTFTSVNIGTASAPNLIPQDLVNLSLFGPAVAVNLTSSSAPDILVGNTVLLNVYGAAPTTTSTPTVTVTPSPSSITSAQSTAVTIAVSGGSGATPTGSVTLSSGTYGSAATRSQAAALFSQCLPALLPSEPTRSPRPTRPTPPVPPSITAQRGQARSR